MIVAVCIVIAIFAVSAYAAKAWYTCTVVQGGPGWGTVYICLTDDGGAFTNKWFSPRTDSRKEQLATSLTAMSNGQKVWCSIDITKNEYPTINAMYLGEPPTP